MMKDVFHQSMLEVSAPKKIEEEFKKLKTGDVIYACLFGNKRESFRYQYGLGNAVCAAVRAKESDFKLQLYMSPNIDGSHRNELPAISQRLSVEDVSKMSFSPAESYVAMASGNKFQYGQNVIVETINQGLVIATLQMFFCGTAGATDTKGHFLIGDARYFTPVDRKTS